MKNSLNLASDCYNCATLGSPTPDIVKIKAVYQSFFRDEQHNVVTASGCESIFASHLPTVSCTVPTAVLLLFYFFNGQEKLRNCL